MKKNNPYTPIMVREAKGIEPRVYARYEFGVEKVADLKGEWWTLSSEKAEQKTCF
jgi:NADH dehydrogenase (ubiquinone) 1 alpha subcomplex subunit 2